jgi:hypothetical protein
MHTHTWNALNSQVAYRDWAGLGEVVDQDEDGTSHVQPQRKSDDQALSDESARVLHTLRGLSRRAGRVRVGRLPVELVVPGPGRGDRRCDQWRTVLLAFDLILSDAELPPRVACAPRAHKQRRPHATRERGRSPAYTPRTIVTIHAPAY